MGWYRKGGRGERMRRVSVWFSVGFVFEWVGWGREKDGLWFRGIEARISCLSVSGVLRREVMWVSISGGAFRDVGAM